VKILTSQVHPLNNHSVPYNFSSTLSPLLHNAARALNLPARSSETFASAFDLSPTPPHASVSSGRASAKSVNGSPPLASENIPPVDGHYTGHILVSGYNISYVLPKAFPSRRGNLQSETEGESSYRSPFNSRRLSIGERNTAQFMAAIDMWVPYMSRPPRSPYLVCKSFPFLQTYYEALLGPIARNPYTTLFAQQHQTSYLSAHDDVVLICVSILHRRRWGDLGPHF